MGTFRHTIKVLSCFRFMSPDLGNAPSDSGHEYVCLYLNAYIHKLISFTGVHEYVILLHTPLDDCNVISISSTLYDVETIWDVCSVCRSPLFLQCTFSTFTIALCFGLDY